MKFFKYLTVAAIMATSFIVCSCENEGGLTSIRGRLDELEQVVIPSINQQITAINGSVESLNKTSSLLTDYIKTIQDDISDLGSGITPDTKKLQNQIDSLAAVTKKFTSDLDDLKKYVNDTDASTRDWASATFATLEQYNTVQTDLSTIKSQLEKIDVDKLKSDILSSLKDELSSSIKKSEDSMKSWVGEQLEGYYTIAEINAKLAELSTSGSANLSDEDKALIDNLKEELKSAKEELTKAYQEAIKKAISDNEGVVDEKIASAIKAATETANKTLEDITKRIDDLEDRIEAVEEQIKTLLQRVQSIAVVPEYNDGSVSISASENSVVRFEIYPSEAAEAIAKLGNDALSLRAVYTKTKADAGEFVELDIVSCAFADGIFSVTTSGNKLDESFFENELKASARLLVTYSGTSVSSQYFPICPAE